MKRLLKNGINHIAVLIKFYYLKFSKNYKKVDISNPKTIPIIIISFNQLFYLKDLIFTLHKWNYNNIIIIDNASTYKPLIDYFDEIKEQVSIHRLKRNYGHMVFWKKRELFMLYGKSYYIVTDADIVPYKECPEDFLLYFKNLLDKNKGITKVGFSLKIDDIPESNPNKQKVIKWESKFWEQKIDGGYFYAEIDTTFALYRPKENPVNKNFYRAIRTGPPYIAKHGGWYIDSENLTKEQKYYMETSNSSSSWRLDENGNLINEEYK